MRIMSSVMFVATLLTVLASFQDSAWAYPRGDEADSNEGETNTR